MAQFIEFVSLFVISSFFSSIDFFYYFNYNSYDKRQKNNELEYSMYHLITFGLNEAQKTKIEDS
jgi:hypothetical protein